jgi:hypothetical protein
MKQSRLCWAARLCPLAVLTLALAPSVLAQGIQTATLGGVVKSTDGLPLPGVVVTLTSPALQGGRSAVTDENGSYLFRGLPSGTYKMAMTLSGFATVERSVTLALGDTPNLSTAMKVAGVEETISVTAEAPSILNTSVVGQKMRAEEIDKIASNRNLVGIANLSPGLTDNSPNVGQLHIAGAYAFDNVYLLNGVDINDNLFGTANNLFIEDAIEEVQTLTSGVSAEYGRFSGGVINAVTKRGGNDFRGSFRTDLSNPSWQDENPFEKQGNIQHSDVTSKIYQATLGGPVLKDRLWFFGAHQRTDSTTPGVLSNSGIGYDTQVQNRRYEGKLTGTLAKNHTFQGTYSKNSTIQDGQPSINATASMDPRVLLDDRQTPNSLFVANYTGVLTSRLFVDARYSQKKFGFRNSGGTSTDIKDSPFMTQGRMGIPSGRHYNGPYFDASDPENRDNRQYAASLAYFLSSGNAGRHDLKLGGESYTSTRTGGNSQSSTGFVFNSDAKTQGATPLLDNGRFIPVFVPGLSTVQEWIPVKGAQIDITTLGLYANDRWQLGERWNFNLGVRYEKVRSEATGDIVGADHSTILPRLAASFDPKGDGKWTLSATYGHYSGKYNERQFGSNTNVGSPSSITRQYTGPAGEGLGFAPGFDLANYTVITAGNFPTANVFFDKDLHSPKTREWTLQAGARLGSHGEVKAIYTNRDTSDFIEDFFTIDLGKTTVIRDGRNFGTFDNRMFRNSDEPVRKYQGLQLQGRYRVTDWWNVLANWTWQIKNEGTIEGEAANQPGNASLIGDRPEIYVLARNNPYGRFDEYEKNRVRLFSFWDVRMGRAGMATIGVTYRYDSPLTYSLSAASVPLSAIQRSRNPGYATMPTTQTLFFGERGSEFYNASHLFDLALNYDIKAFKSVRPYLKAELRNALNGDPLIRFDNTITANLTGPLDADGLPTTYTKGSNFGKGTANNHYPTPREFRFSVGFRF